MITLEARSQVTNRPVLPEVDPIASVSLHKGFMLRGLATRSWRYTPLSPAKNQVISGFWYDAGGARLAK
ncbi:hypothetical protein M408DRAFT_330055 [Serendipita vermifera MAFF 305830]|uniref:Uncharacterized protein n=1 Tax=Serendipita vermifera MAFF 305830 TaxID=933852 RepID=A0A0C2WLZ8_SERVB|nr:hypothetical protein M408DRAFT_330055 [Serendipita vermifera MAFF 305830]